ncbi:Hypothetical protein SRAE_2000127700 [Strongyloides ratti]|uniref:Uncharacterized protein n=1 Tax=Strongyloides ratti TaxID=34506 RepID=A0A090MY58_STRRB|nr:Hypothetical protein SRAE_2000127700 [Strongyloides ratti]CEF66609.1 Hypothetical protein SRAE_2000127700 [Strongyloides ratti]
MDYARKSTKHNISGTVEYLKIFSTGQNTIGECWYKLRTTTNYINILKSVKKMAEKETQCTVNQDNIINEKLNDTNNLTTVKSINSMDVDGIKTESESSISYGKYDGNLLRSCILNGNYTLRKKDDDSLVVQVGHSVFNASFSETCGSDLLFPVERDVSNYEDTFGNPLTSDIRLICKKTNNPFYKDPLG